MWHALSSYVVGPQDVRLSFVQRLARENGWGETHALRVFDEYRRFCFLAVTGHGEVTPSDAVDQAWHLHLTYSRDYWERFCPEILRRPLHHGPTAGGDVERCASSSNMPVRCNAMSRSSAYRPLPTYGRTQHGG